MSNMYTVMEQPLARKFLSAIGRNSKSSESSYAVALSHFQNLLDNKAQTLSSIVKALLSNEINVYDLLDDFVTFLMEKKNSNDSNGKISFKSIQAYMAAIRSYLQYNKIDIIPYRFKHQVKMPKVIRRDEESIDAADIREILLHTTSRRLKPYELGLGSGGMRTIELASIRLCDLDLENNTINIRGEFTKTKEARYTFISDEAVKFLNEWITWKYRPRRTATNHKAIAPMRNDEDLVFAIGEDTDPHSIYEKMRLEFNKVLVVVNKGSRKDGAQRRKITLNSLRRFAKTTVSDLVSTDYSEWFIGHAKSSYWTKKPFEKLEIYKSKCMKYLSFLDYTTLEATGKSNDARLVGLESENTALKRELQDLKNNPEIESMKKQMDEMVKAMYEAGILKKD